MTALIIKNHANFDFNPPMQCHEFLISFLSSTKSTQKPKMVLEVSFFCFNQIFGYGHWSIPLRQSLAKASKKQIFVPHQPPLTDKKQARIITKMLTKNYKRVISTFSLHKLKTLDTLIFYLHMVNEAHLYRFLNNFQESKPIAYEAFEKEKLHQKVSNTDIEN